MKAGYNNDPQKPWRPAELDPETAQYVRQQLAQIPNLPNAVLELAQDLPEDGSRTVRQFPINIATGNVPRTMVGATMDIARALWAEGMYDLGSAFETIENELPEQMRGLSAADLPAGAKARIDLTAPFGYLRVDRTPTGAQASVGCFEPQTGMCYSLPL